jgi:hypothetical protein
MPKGDIHNKIEGYTVIDNYKFISCHNKTGYDGLYYKNRAGKYQRVKNDNCYSLKSPERNNDDSISKLLKGIEITNENYNKVAELAKLLKNKETILNFIKLLIKPVLDYENVYEYDNEKKIIYKLLPYIDVEHDYFEDIIRDKEHKLAYYFFENTDNPEILSKFIHTYINFLNDIKFRFINYHSIKNIPQYVANKRAVKSIFKQKNIPEDLQKEMSKYFGFGNKRKKVVKKKKVLTKALKNQARKYKVKITLKHGNKRVYKSEKMLKKQIAIKRSKL